MIYTWDNNHRNKTFRLCIDTLNKTKGTDIKFNFCEASINILTVWLIIGDKGNWRRTYYWTDLADATEKPFPKFTNKIDFEKLTDEQYVSLCKYIIKDLWELTRRM